MNTKNGFAIYQASRVCFYRQLVTLLFLCIASANLFAQASLSTKSKKAIAYYKEADNYRVRRQYTQAEALLNDAIKKDAKFVEAYVRLGIVYMDMKQIDKAKAAFEKAYALKPDDKRYKQLYFWMGELYVILGEYDQAKKVLSQYLGYYPVGRQAPQAKVLLKNTEYALANSQESQTFNPEPLSDTVNSFHLQYFPVLTADQTQIIYTRRLGVGPSYDEDLVISRKDANGRWGKPQSLSKSINSVNNEGTCTISADGRMLIFTSCLGRKGYGSCDLFVTYKTGDNWSVPQNLGSNVNTSAWESQPSLSSDGRVLYFVSDRKGGLGRRDIYMTRKQANGEWSKPENLGPQVNTALDEVSPFIHANGKTLYFATNGLTGFGGFDIFFTERDGNRWLKPTNLGAPVNTGEDQLSLFITADGKKGYYSHESIKENDVRGKLFVFDVPEYMQIKYKSNFIKGIVYDKETKKPLKANIELFDLEANEMVGLTNSDSISGEYIMVLTQGSKYALYVDKEKYLFQSLSFDYEQQEQLEPVIKDIYLEAVKVGRKTTLENVFFDVDKYELKEESKTELEKAFRFIKGNNSMRVEIGGHTDNSGSAIYNKTLSQKRAKAVYDYLINTLGLPKAQLSYKGYGQEKPVAPNDTKANKSLNRRIEFTITK